MLGLDNAFAIREMLVPILARDIPIESFVDWKTVFDFFTKEGRTTDRIWQIDVAWMHDSYAIGELASIAWIPGSINIAESLTKPVINDILQPWRADDRKRH